MTTGKEIELKYVLASPSDAEKLKSVLGAPLETIHQENTFFDTDRGGLIAARSALRLRIERPEGGEARAVLAFKSSGRIEEALAVRDEIECGVDAAAASAAIASGTVAELLATGAAREVRQAAEQAAGDLGEGPLNVVGGFSNVRHVYRPARLGGGELLLDMVTYPPAAGGAEVIELEAEAASEPEVPALREAVEEMLNVSGASFSPGTEGKYARLRRLITQGSAP